MRKRIRPKSLRHFRADAQAHPPEKALGFCFICALAQASVRIGSWTEAGGPSSARPETSAEMATSWSSMPRSANWWSRKVRPSLNRRRSLESGSASSPGRNSAVSRRAQAEVIAQAPRNLGQGNVRHFPGRRRRRRRLRPSCGPDRAYAEHPAGSRHRGTSW